MEIVIASTNAHKIQEYNEMVKDYQIKFLSLKDINFKDEIIEDGKTFKENSLIKAKAIASKTSLDILSDDSGIIIEQLGNNFPGIYSHRYALENGGQVNLNKMLVNKVAGSTAYFVCVLTFIHQGKIYQFEGKFNGKIANYVSSEQGFGYDPIFIPDGYDVTVGELDAKIKNAISHRSNAFNKFLNFLKENNLLLESLSE